ncbi:hypothetical protein BCF33_1752 [Hasllibacter halocynthiae]|uniref:Imelysin-like domain-containing protein n=1 Tax=Hasllibacter halocynthiae TaxID=595589 RepID=A0A2T0X1R3_9RHOB|nr:imelysin family protein [Hasllibacter halocynthiae]PRY92889.1 hypothetical protein BCF33_1752 [Hasllibacter halocynthiae]
MRLALALALLAAPAAPAPADVDAALEGHVLPRIAALADAAEALSDAAAEGCEGLEGPFRDAAEAWAGASHLTLGPLEEGGRLRIVHFWPDGRDATARGLRLLREGGEGAWTPEGIARASAAARGLAGLERLIFEDGGEPCALTAALAADLAALTGAVDAGWDGFAALMRAAGEPGNARFLAPGEAEAALYTALVGGLEFTAEQRLGRPLGTFDAPRPLRAEMRRSERSLPNVAAALRALRELAALLADAPETDAAFARAIALADGLEDPALAGVAEPSERLRVEALQTAVREVWRTAEEEIGAALDVPAGFNALDGD